jgi:hypothetical protein
VDKYNHKKPQLKVSIPDKRREVICQSGRIPSINRANA